MKKMLKVLFPLIGISLASTIYADTALTCKDFTGEWRGSFGTYEWVTLNIINTYQDDMSASMRFKDPVHKDGTGPMYGKCQVNVDGTVTATFTDDTPPGPINLTYTLIDAKNLYVKGKVWRFTPFDGQLTKVVSN